MTCSGWPVKRLRSTGSWVATPTGQVLRWHLRIMMQPAAIRGAAAEPLAHQGLVGFGKADFPGGAGVLDRGEGGGTGAALEACDGDVVGARFRDTGGDRADADFGDQLHRYQSVRTDVLEIVDQLRQILDRIDVVMRWRRD